VRKLSSQINVQTGDGQEGFEWHADELTLQPHPHSPPYVTENRR
jgi:hypothetical protein